MTTRTSSVQANQLRNGLMQARETLIATMDAATRAMNAAQARLAQQMADSSNRAEARKRAELMEQVMRVTQDAALRVQNLANNAASAAGAADTAASGLVAALEASGRVVRSCVEAKDALLREVDGVAGVARNHLRAQGTPVKGSDPLNTLARSVADALERAGSMVEDMQQASVQASILAAQSLSAVAHEQWDGAAAELVAVGKEVAAALQDAVTVTAATQGSGTEAQAARFATWEQLSAADAAVAASIEGLSRLDEVVNGQLQVTRRNDRNQGSPGLWATYSVKPPVVPPGSGSDPGTATGWVEPTSVVFLAVPAAEAAAFSQAAVDAALEQKQYVPARKASEVEGNGRRSRYETAHALSVDATGDRLTWGQSYRVFAVELDSDPGSRRGARSASSRISLPSLPITTLRGLTKWDRPRVHQLCKGQPAYVVRFDRVQIEGLSKTPRVASDACIEYRLLFVRRSVWETWEGLHGPDEPTVEKRPGAAAALRPAADEKVTGAVPDVKQTKTGRPVASETSPPPDGAAIEAQLARQREILLGSTLNEEDWYVLSPLVGAVDDWVGAIAERYEEDVRVAEGPTAKPLTKEELAALKQTLKPAAGEGDVESYLFCYLHPLHVFVSTASVTDAGARPRKPAKPTKDVVPIGRFTDVRGELLDPDLTEYVAVVYIAGRPDSRNGQSVESWISEPSDPFGSPTAI